MPRTKESDDESETKTGRRSKAITGMNVVDSPLRRSTRNRQQINRDLSPDGINITSGPVTRTTRRKAALQEVFTSETTRTLRSRKTSCTSDTSENHDLETADIKRTTRKSTTAAAATSDTPTNIRLRRSVRAGSESKTIQSPAKTNRLTRASSLDLEDRDNEIQSNLQEAHNSTPIKLRRRASILPSEPALIEEIEKDHSSCQDSLQSIIEDDKKEINDSEEKNNTVDDFSKHTDSTKSPVLQLSRGFTPEVETDTDRSNDNPNDTSTSPSKSSSGCSLKSILEETNDSRLKEETTILNKSKNQIHEIIQTPKVVVEKMKFPFDEHTSESLDISLNNKENEKSNATAPTKKFSSSEEASTQRKSLITTASEKISIVKRLNKTADDKMLVTNENSSDESLSISKKSFELFPDIKMINENVFSVNVGSSDESIIITEEIKASDCNVENSKNSSMQQEQSLKDTSLNLKINDNLDISEENNAVKKPLPQNDEISMEVTDKEETNSSKEKSQIIDETSNLPSPSIGSEKACKEREVSPLTIEEVNSIVDESENDKSEKEITMETNFEDELPVIKDVSPSKESNKSVDNESDYDLNQLFKDIPADEWNEEPIPSSENDNFEGKNLNMKPKSQENITDDRKEERNFEKESVEDFELVLVDKKAWEAAEADRLKKMKEVNDFVSLDTLQTDTAFRKSIDPPASPSFEEAMDIDENETETVAEQVSGEIKNTSNNSSLEASNNDQQVLNESNDNIEKECEKKDTPVSNEFNTVEKEMKLNQITPTKDSSTTSSNNLLTKDNNLPVRKSLDSLLSKNKTLKTTPLKTRKSLNSFIKLDNATASVTADINEQDEIKSSIESLENSTNKSLNISESENTHGMDTEEGEEKKKEDTPKASKDINKSLNQSISKKTEDKLCNTPPKETITKNVISQVNSESDKLSTDSENESDDPALTLPPFLYGETSDSSNQQENDSSSTNSDVAREYNLNGDNVLEYSDDNVPGDVCHASETESTESDEEDEDMADFIVDDDEEIDEEMEDEESESESGSDDEKEKIIDNNKNDEDRSNDEDGSNEEIGDDDDDDEANDEFEESENEMFDKNIDVIKPNKKKEKYQHQNKSTPSKSIILQENNLSENKDPVSKMITPKVNKLNTPQSDKSMQKGKLTSLKKSKTNLENSFTVDDSPPASKLPTMSSFNKSMLLPFSTSPETRLLLKEKLNDTLPALKLEQSDKRRKSSLHFVEEDVENDKPVEIGTSKKSIDEISEGKIRKKKQNQTTKCEQYGFNVENISTQSHESSQLSKISTKNLEKKKKKALKENSSLNSNASSEKKNEKVKKKQKLVETKKNEEKLISTKNHDQTSTEKKKKKKDSNKDNVVLKRERRLSSEAYYTAEEIDTDSIKNLKDGQKSNKSKNNLPKFTNSEADKSSNVPSLLPTRNKVKRLPDDVIEGLLDVPIQPKKKRKLLVDQKVLPSRKMFDSEHPKPDNISIEDEGYIPLSSSGGTTSFYVMNLEKPKKSKKLAAVYSFRERMLRRNQRQPISAYLMYQQKLKASRNDKY